MAVAPEEIVPNVLLVTAAPVFPLMKKFTLLALPTRPVIRTPTEFGGAWPVEAAAAVRRYSTIVPLTRSGLLRSNRVLWPDEHALTPEPELEISAEYGAAES